MALQTKMLPAKCDSWSLSPRTHVEGENKISESCSLASTHTMASTHVSIHIHTRTHLHTHMHTESHIEYILKTGTPKPTLSLNAIYPMT